MQEARCDLNTLAAYIEGRLPARDRAAITAHLAECAQCRAALATWSRSGRADAGTRRTARSRVSIRTWMPIAASLAVLAVSATLLTRANREPASDLPRRSTAADIVLPPEATAAAAEPAPQAGTPSQPPAAGDETVTRGATIRLVGGKRFQFVAGEWIDEAYDPLALLPVETIAGPDLRRSLVRRIPALRAYDALGSRVTVVHDGRVYRLAP